jgi:hypothetical protein
MPGQSAADCVARDGLGVIGSRPRASRWSGLPAQEAAEVGFPRTRYTPWNYRDGGRFGNAAPVTVPAEEPAAIDVGGFVPAFRGP